MRKTLLSLAVLVVCLAWPGSANAQTTAAATPQTATPQSALVKVFLDCDRCDSEYLKQNVTFVDYVRDRNVADVHVFVTTQNTGGGGDAWTVKFIGVGRFQDVNRTLTFNTSSVSTEDERRKEFARIFRIGIVAYALETSAAPDLDVTWNKKTVQNETKPTKDPWNYWVFNVGGGGNFNGQSLDKSGSYYGNVSASRTTEEWKFNLSAGRDENRSEFIVSTDETVISRRSSWSVGGIIVKSLGPKWSFGTNGSASHSTFSNEDRVLNIMPGIEFDVFPYSESAERSLTFQYNVGATHYDYVEETIYGKLSETVPRHQISASLGLRQPWGSVGASANVSQHLNHLDRYSAGVSGSADVRLFKGFSFNIFGSYSKIADQISLPASFLSTEEILLHTRQRPTSHSYYFGFGINYSFGSIFNSTVNPRFGGGGGMRFFFG